MRPRHHAGASSRPGIGHNDRMDREKRRLPAWLLGLIIAVVLFVLVLVLANTLGFGDDPVVGAFR